MKVLGRFAQIATPAKPRLPAFRIFFTFSPIESLETMTSLERKPTNQITEKTAKKNRRPYPEILLVRDHVIDRRAYITRDSPAGGNHSNRRVYSSLSLPRSNGCCSFCCMQQQLTRALYLGWHHLHAASGRICLSFWSISGLLPCLYYSPWPSRRWPCSQTDEQQHHKWSWLASARTHRTTSSKSLQLRIILLRRRSNGGYS